MNRSVKAALLSLHPSTALPSKSRAAISAISAGDGYSGSPTDYRDDRLIGQSF